jgi:hypothetical protein
MDIKFRRNIIPLIITVLGVFICIRFNVFEIILSVLQKIGFKYGNYGFSKYATQRAARGTGLGVFVKILPCLLAVFMAPVITKKYPRKAFLVNLSIVYIWSFFLSAQFMILGRLRDIFVFVPILITGFAIESTGKYKKIVAIALVSLNLLLFERDIINLPNTGYARWMNPYYSIFSDITREEIHRLNVDEPADDPMDE